MKIKFNKFWNIEPDKIDIADNKYVSYFMQAKLEPTHGCL